MKLLLPLLVLLFLTACPRQATTAGKYQMTCESVATWMFRCENIETVCYAFNGEALQCQWKRTNK